MVRRLLDSLTCHVLSNVLNVFISVNIYDLLSRKMPNCMGRTNGDWDDSFTKAQDRYSILK